MDNINWIYENSIDNEWRYCLGIEGENPLICIGVNPSTAEPGLLDRTMENVKWFAEQNGYDGFIMVNLYPQRATNPDDLEKTKNDVQYNENLKQIEKVLESKASTIWAAWGTLIEKRKYLLDSLVEIYDIAEKYGANWVSLGQVSKAGHPHHPLYLKKNLLFDPFDIKRYIKD